MRSMGWLVGGALVVVSLTSASEARATCAYDCSMRMVNDDCSAPEQVDDGVYQWERVDQVRMLATCTVTCCSPEGDCSTEDTAEPPLDAFRLRDASADYADVETEWSSEAACEGTVVSGSAALQVGHVYDVDVDLTSSLEFEVIDDSALGCRIGGGHGGLGVAVLVLLGLVSRRRWG